MEREGSTRTKLKGKPVKKLSKGPAHPPRAKQVSNYN